VESNLECLEKILEYNVEHELLFFRISSDLIPFASHPICTIKWQEIFASKLKELGTYVKNRDIRISMHPDQFVLINSPSEDLFKRSVAELQYHADVLDSMQLDQSAKIQIHVGGVYGDKKVSTQRFIERYHLLPDAIKQRLVIENDDRLFSVLDCSQIHQATGIPILFDNFHHALLNNGESLQEAMDTCFKTWRDKDGLPMIDYSSQAPDERVGKHTFSIDEGDFVAFLKESKNYDFDLMLEIKDKENSALKALKVADSRIVKSSL
jgi:UV DNA damage endonuclease